MYYRGARRWPRFFGLVLVGLAGIIVPVIAGTVAPVLVAVVAAAATLLLLAVPRFLLLGDDALIVFGKLIIGFRQNAVAAGLGVARILLVLFEHLLGRPTDFHIRTDRLEVPVWIVEIILVTTA
jgi:hypothetical protein